MGKHSVRTAGVLTELQVGDCKLDLMLVNGETVAYEIKTELDSPDRLFNQLCTYQRAFERVYLVTHESCAARFASGLPPGIGILQLTSRYSFRTIQDADRDFSRLDPGVIFNMLRRVEYTGIIRKYFGSVPDVPNTRIYTECRRLFLDIPVPNISAELVSLFHERCRKSLALPYQEVDSTPHALTLHALSGDLSRRQYDALERVLL